MQSHWVNSYQRHIDRAKSANSKYSRLQRRLYDVICKLSQDSDYHSLHNLHVSGNTRTDLTQIQAKDLYIKSEHLTDGSLIFNISWQKIDSDTGKRLSGWIDLKQTSFAEIESDLILSR